MWGSIAQQIGSKSVKLETVDLEIVGEMARWLTRLGRHN
jgi:hypothetical protein